MPMATDRTLIIIGVIAVLASVLIVILVPMSFKPLEHYQMGFKQRQSTGTVSMEKVYLAGNHPVGPDYSFKKFDKDAHYEVYDSINVFTSDRLEVQLTASLQYFLRPHQLQNLFRDFNTKYHSVLRNNALDAIKGEATFWSTREFIRNRNQVERSLFSAVRDRLGGPCCELNCEKKGICVPGCKPYLQCTAAEYGLYAEVRYFQLGRVQIPNELNERYVQALILQEQTQTEKLYQQAQLIRKETERKVKEIGNEAEETRQNATSKAAVIVSRAEATAQATLENARTSGLADLYSELGLDNSEEKMSFQYLRTLRKQENAKLAVDFTHLVTK